MMHQIAQEAHDFQYLRERLKAEFPDADEETLCDTVAGLTNRPEMLAAVVRSHLDDKSLVTALRARIADMHERLARFEVRAGKKRELVMSAYMSRMMSRRILSVAHPFLFFRGCCRERVLR